MNDEQLDYLITTLCKWHNTLEIQVESNKYDKYAAGQLNMTKQVKNLIKDIIKEG